MQNCSEPSFFLPIELNKIKFMRIYARKLCCITYNLYLCTVFIVKVF